MHPALVVPGAPATPPAGPSDHLCFDSRAMEPSKAGDGGAPSSPNPNAHDSNFTFTTAPSASSSCPSKPRFAKVQKQNDAPSFNPFRDVSVPSLKTDSLDKGIADQMRSLRIGNVNEVPDAKGRFAFVFGRSGFDKSVSSSSSSSSGFDEIGNSASKDASNLKIEETKDGNGSDRNIGVELGLEGGLRTKLNTEEASGDQVPSEKHKEEDIRIGIMKSDEFVFTGKKDDSGSSFVEFKTPAALKTNAVGVVDEKFKFSAKKEQGGSTRMNKSRAKLKHSSTPSFQVLHGHDSILNERVSQGNSESLETCSPMDVSSYQEALAAAENQCSRESSVTLTSNESFSIDNDSTATESVQTNEDLIVGRECSNMNECEIVGSETREETSVETHVCENICGEDPQDESISGVETRSFKSVNDEVDITGDVAPPSAETGTSACSSMEAHDGDSMSHLGCASNSGNISGFGFTFAASSSAEAQSSSPKRHPKKKNWVKVGHDAYNSTPNMKVPNSSPSAAFSPFSGASSLFRSGQGQKASISAPSSKTRDSEGNKDQGTKEEPASISAATIGSQEACEKWRLKGNQAYKNGNLSMAEDCYTQGIKCASREAASQSCCRALMLCYSNRAATRMSLGRMRDAIEDCMLAAEIEPNFLRVQLRAANCYLAMGEVEDASQYFKRCVQSGNDSGVDQKIAVETSELLQKAQKISEFINHSAEILQRRTASDAEKALEHINEALMISSYSEKLLEMKAEALLMLCRYEEVIQLCDETLGSAEKNSYPLDAGCRVEDLDSLRLSKGFYFRLWRCSMILKSYFHLGKLDEGLSFLEAQDRKVSAVDKSGSKVLESLIPLAVTVRELLHHKTAGNEAFQAGRHEEAVAHYTAALSCSVESRPFAAVCFCNRADAYQALGQITDAVADCNLAIALDGKYLKALYRRATLYEVIRDYDQAASDLRRIGSLLTKEAEDKTNEHGISDRSFINDLKQNHIRLSEIEEEARKGIALDVYLILGVESSVLASGVKKAYRKAALRHHPDKAAQFLARGDSGDDRTWKDIAEEVHGDADRLFKIIGKAYAVLSDPAKRSQYDAEEEMRNSQQKRHRSNMARNNVDTQYCPFEQSSSTRQWKESWRSHGNSSHKGSEPGRSNRQ